MVSNQTAKLELDKSRARVAEIETIEAKRIAKENHWWQPVLEVQSPQTKIEAAQAYLQNIPDGDHAAKATEMISQAQEELREEKRLWQPVIEANSPQTTIQMAQIYLQAKPDGLHAAEAKGKIADAAEKIRLAEEQKWWQSVLDAKSPQEQIEIAKAYLQAKPNGDHVADARQVIAQANEALLKKKEERWWQPVEQADSLDIKAEKPQFKGPILEFN